MLEKFNVMDRFNANLARRHACNLRSREAELVPLSLDWRTLEILDVI